MGNDSNGFPIYKEDLDVNDPANILSWIDFPSQIVIPADYTKEFNFKVNIPKDADPGGRYIGFTFRAVEGENGGITTYTNFNGILVLGINGDVQEEGVFEDFALDLLADDKPAVFQVNFKNTGNVHLKPFGTIELFDNDGKKLDLTHTDPKTGRIDQISSLEINPDYGNTLPGNSRKYTVSLGDLPWDQKVVAKLVANYGISKEEYRDEISLDFTKNIRLAGFSFRNKSFKVKLDNQSSEVNIRPKGVVKIMNELDFQVDEIKIPESAEYVKPGEKKEVVLIWDKNIPKGDYRSQYISEEDELKSEIIDLSAGGLNRMDLLTSTNLLIAGLALLVLIFLIVLIRRKKGNRDEG